MDKLFSDRIQDVPRSFIREILTVALQPGMISFAGGLPNRLLFPTQAIQQAADEVFANMGQDVLQYASSEGDVELREWISRRYRQKEGLDIPVENILITSGSQQGLDLLGKVMINDGDHLGIESPGYLGAIQAFSIYKPKFISLPVSDGDESNSDGLDKGLNIEALQACLSQQAPKLIYTVSSFQNPSGGSYAEANKRAVAKAISSSPTLLIDDNPYGELRFSGEATTPFWNLLPNQTVLLGSFSKVIAPGLRLGWIAASKPLIDKLLIAKQASDLHTSLLPQRIIYQYLQSHSLDDHIKTIVNNYGQQCDTMLAAIKREFPPEVKVSRPDGGMFLWASLPKPLTAMGLFNHAVEQGVVFVPGDPFYIDPKEVCTMRLNFSCADEPMIEEGIKRLGQVMKKQLRTL